MEKYYLISDKLRQALIQYLLSKPYSEVASAIPLLEHLEEAPPPVPLVKDPDLTETANA